MNILFKKNIVKIEYKYTTIRSYIDKSLTNFNLFSRVLFIFLVYMTFEKAKTHNQFGEHSIEVFINNQEYLGTYSYCEIGKEFGLTNTLKQFEYFKRVMRREPHHSHLSLTQLTKKWIYTMAINIKYKGRPTNLKYNNAYFKYF